MNILEKANDIVFNRSEEKERMYGPFEDSMKIAAEIASNMCSKEITAVDIAKCMVAVKLSREAFSHKEDNILDAIAYLTIINQLNSKKI